MPQPGDWATEQGIGAIGTAVDCIPVTASATPFARPARAIRCEGAGTIVITTLNGNSRTLYFKDGETRFVGATAITTIAGTITACEIML